MNDNETILAELRKIGAWADMQRKITKWSFIVIAVIIPAMIVFGIVMEKRLTTSVENISSHEKPEKPAWSRSEEHTSELQSHLNLVCRLLLEKKKRHNGTHILDR